MSTVTGRCQVCFRGAANDGHSCVSMFESSLAEMGITAVTARRDMPRMLEAQAHSRLRIAQLEAEVQALREENARLTADRDDAKSDSEALRAALTGSREELIQLRTDLDAAIKLLRSAADNLLNAHLVEQIEKFLKEHA